MTTDVWKRHVVFLSVFAFCGSSSYISVSEDGGYKNIMVAIAPDIPRSEGEELLKKLEDAFKEASSFLYEATYHLAYFKSVTFLLPPKWENTANSKNSTYQTYHAADIRVINTAGNAEDAFETIQPNGCGQPGRYIQVNKDKFDISEESYRARHLAQHWAKYRYGVFEENGVEKSELYPKYYKDDSGIKKTGCTEPYPWITDVKCDLENPDNCFTLNASVDVLTSFLDFENNKAQYFCNATSHNPDAPTRHNDICRQKSVYDVIRSSSDFADIHSPDALPKVPDVTFDHVFFTLKPAVIVADNKLCTEGTDQNLSNTVITSVGKAILSILPEDLKLLLLVDRKYPDDQKSFLSDKTKSYDDWYSEVCTDRVEPGTLTLKIVINEAIKSLETGGHLILLVDGITIDTEDLIHAVNSSQVKDLHLYVITYRALPFDRAEQWVDAVEKNNVKWYNILNNETYPDGIDFTAWRQIDMAFIDIRDQMGPGFSDQTLTCYSELKEFENKIEVNFSVTAAEASVTFSLNANNDRIGKLKWWLNDEQMWEESVQLKQKDKTNLVYAAERTLQAGSYTFKLNDTNLQRASDGYFFSIVQSSKDAESFEVSANVDQAAENYTVLQVAVRNKGAAVHKAHVMASLKERNVSLILRDDGKNGDIIQGDGIYSHFFKPPEQGIYFVEYVVNYLAEDKQRADGTDVPFTVIKLVSFTFKGDPNYDSIPPSRIVDLKFENIEEIYDYFRATLNWTAPGNDFDVGIVAKYQLRCSGTRSLVSIDAGFDDVVTEIKATKAAGEIETYTWEAKLEYYERGYFCAVRAFDAVGNHNMLSNVATKINYVITGPTTTTRTQSVKGSATTPSNVTLTRPLTSQSGHSTDTGYTTESTDGQDVDTLKESLLATKSLIIGFGSATIVLLLFICVSIVIGVWLLKSNRSNTSGPSPSSHPPKIEMMSTVDQVDTEYEAPIQHRRNLGGNRRITATPNTYSTPYSTRPAPEEQLYDDVTST